ncbi:polysaccharide deacetylase family protein [Mangrovicella endophytica]|uniref:polysaccharide deacetylase family protein n=1 Tax=Mangrovicella endophytica TaxID=2066697 RepID=UPI000C9E1457|nr:polysaccharide deacetylase [Mangrovicella endophytica]
MLKLVSNPPPWPNGARCAVCFSFDFDAESLLHLYYPEDSARRISLSSTLRYGARVAVPRIAAIWKHYGIRQTMFVPGWCIETYPAAVEALLEGGHEIGHHGWLHERPNQLSRDDEEAVLLRGIEAIRAATGKPPTGYRCPSGAFSEHTLDLLLANGFRYDASLGGDDVPYLVEGANGARLVELPSDHSLDDWPQYVNMKEFGWSMPIQSPARAMEVFRADFDAAWEHGGVWAAIWHPFVSGRLARAAAMVELIEYMQAKGGVWFATLSEIAAHVDGLAASGAWTPPVERLPFWPEPVPQLVRPSR